MAKKTAEQELPKPLNPPTGAELEILAILWALGNEDALKLSEIHSRIGKGRRAQGLPEPAITTVSSALRGALAKGLLREVRRTSDSSIVAAPRSAVRTPLLSTRSPQTAYQAAHAPGPVLQPILKALADSYPEPLRRQAIIDLALAMELPDADIDRLKKALGLL
jgi:hypothetical protein